jgi:hypothetical protein
MRRVRLVDGLERRLARLEGKDLEAATESELLDMLEEVRKTDHRVYKELRRRVEARETLARSCDAKKVGPKVSKIGTYGANIFATNFLGVFAEDMVSNLEAGNGKCRLRLQVKGGGCESKKLRCSRSRETAAP